MFFYLIILIYTCRTQLPIRGGYDNNNVVIHHRPMEQPRNKKQAETLIENADQLRCFISIAVKGRTMEDDSFCEKKSG